MTRYGPHDRATAPYTAQEPIPGTYATHTLDLDPRIIAQRKQINDAAQGLPVTRLPVDPGHPAWRERVARTPQEAQQRRDNRMDQAENGTSQEWIDAARRAVWDLATNRRDFTTDDVWHLLEQRGVPAPREPRALGPVVFKALRSGAIRDTGRIVRSVRRHSTKITVYERTPR